MNKTLEILNLMRYGAVGSELDCHFREMVFDVHMHLRFANFQKMFKDV